jgi:capsular polysaccharide biosynthesis protein
MKEKVYIKDFIAILQRHKKSIVIIIGVASLSLVQLSFILPKTYQSSFELNIYSKYFKNALISEVIPGMNSITEMTQTVDSMIKEVMNDQFIDEIGAQYKIYPANISGVELSKRRQFLRDQFQMFSTGGQSYKINFNHGDPNVTCEVTKKVMVAIREYFISTKLETIENAKKTIQKKLESVNVTKQISENQISANALASKNPEVLKSEISKIEQDLSALKVQFNVQHPRIVKLEQRRATIKSWLKEIEQESVVKDESKTKDYSDAPLLMAGNSEISNTIAAKLFSKFNDINVALDIERKSISGYIGVIEYPQYPSNPLFPKKRLFASLGFMIGLIISFLYVLYKEIMTSTPVEMSQELATELNSEFFGTMPKVDERSLMTNKTLLIENKTAIALLAPPEDSSRSH